MYYIVDTDKSFAEAASDLEQAVTQNNFGVLHIHDLGATLRSKGIAFSEECKVFEVCNPMQASKVMSIDMRLNMALPCRISVYTEAGKVKLGYIKPAEMLIGLSSDPALATIAGEVEDSMLKILADAK
ncbi:DUF302 domain-containing protein [Microbulbifer aggregans]|uniref:DUF302 domain-containing protein n=1 Tax=Microbulbifer aggregans TaxID=1769779 RepID=UPI001CFCC78A|nr:DUF302 domain-containing protein [Microbulbifer aggregans]